jgi:dipeptidyl aminopeptidase/acylaminoacyl peptidase
MKKYLFLLLTPLICFFAKAQDGKLVEQKEYTVADSNITKLKKINPGIDTIVGKVKFYDITYLSDGLKVKGYLVIPKAKGNYPCIIYNRGGNMSLGALSDFQLALILGEVASWGYVVVGSQYRGNMGGEGREEFGGKDVNDILNLIPFLAQVKQADTSRIGMYGWSRGGMMTYLTLTKTSKIKAAVIGAGMADAFKQIAKRPQMDSVFALLAPGYLQNRDSVLKQHSAVYWADKISKTTPLLLMSGSSDWRVLPEEQFEMISKLYENKHPFRFIFFEGGQHSLVEYNEEVNRISKNFLDTYVRDKKQWPSLEPHGN